MTVILVNTLLLKTLNVENQKCGLLLVQKKISKLTCAVKSPECSKIRPFPKTQSIQSRYFCSFFTNHRQLPFLMVSYCHLVARTYSCSFITPAFSSSHLLLLMCILITIHERTMTIWTWLMKVGPVY